MLSGCCGVPAALISSWCLLVQIVGAVWQPIKVMLQAYTVNPGVCSSGSHGGRQKLQMRMQCLEHENCRAIKSAESKFKAVLPMLLFGSILQAGAFPKAHSGFVLEAVCWGAEPARNQREWQGDAAGTLV